MSIRIKAFVAPAVLLACLAWICAQSLMALDSTNEGIGRLASVDLPKRAAIETLSSTLGDAHVLLFRYVSWLNQGVAAADLDRLQKEIAAQNQKIDAAAVEMVSRKDLKPDEEAVLVAARKAIAGYAEQTRSIVEMGASDTGMATMLLSQADGAMHQIRSGVDRLAALNSDLSMTLARDLVRASRERVRLLMATAIGASIAGVLIAWRVTMSLVRPLRSVISVVRGLADGRREMIAPAHAARRDEIGDLARALSVFQQAMAQNALLESEAAARRREAEAARAASENELRDAVETERSIVKKSIGSALTRLAEMDLRHRMNEAIPETYATLRDNFNTASEQLDRALREVHRGAREIQTGTMSIEQASRELASRAEQQAVNLEEAVAELGVLTTTVKKTAEGAAFAHEMVVAVDAGARGGAKVVGDAILAMDEIAKSVTEISRIVGVIDEIAFQTSLLALNAGVEAARAGEAGRGFAIVAAEVRALAQHSAKAAKQIKLLVTASTGRVELGVKLVSETGTALEGIQARVADINGVVAEIATGARDQAAGLDHVNAAIGQMDQKTQRDAAMAEESNAASQTLAEETRLLYAMIGRFQIGAEERRVPPPERALRRA